MSARLRKGIHDPTARATTTDRPLSALLSQTLIAFTLEFDNEFERQMNEPGYVGSRLSLVVWSNLLRFLAHGAVSVRDLATRSMSPEATIKFKLGCLERWRFVDLQPDPTDGRPIQVRPHRRARQDLRDGWGSGRGIRADWLVQPTPKALKAHAIWQPLFGAIERRWQTRFGADEIGRLVESLQTLVSQLDLELRHGLPDPWEVAEAKLYPRRTAANPAPLPLATLLSQSLLAFRIEFDRESKAPLPLCANTLRVLAENPTLRAGDLSHLTGASPERSAVGWPLKPYVVVELDPNATRGKVVRLTPRGLKARQTYVALAAKIEKRWQTRFGADLVRRLRDSLQYLLTSQHRDRPLVAEGLIPPPGVARSGSPAPALGRQDVGAAARQRIRDLVIQTEAFVQDPAGTLPHYPLWDMNRGFGP